MIGREWYVEEIKRHFRVHSVCAILGPRQIGKTTLARTFAAQQNQKSNVFDLENAVDLVRLDNPMTVLSVNPEQLVIIDEIQKRPELFPALRVLVDEQPRKFLILGSASRDLLQQSSETLAGRIGYIELPPFSLRETNNCAQLWMRGGFPRSYVAENDADSFFWREHYISTFLERDIPNLGFKVPAQHLHRFWLMLAHYHGQSFNASEIGKSLGVSYQTCRRYLDILVGTFMVRELVPWHESIMKRQVKTPKIYFRDIGILNTLLNLQDTTAMDRYPRLGALWEGFALEEVIKAFNLRSEECFFWGTQSHAELDFLFFKNGKRIGIEFKYADAPKTTKSMHIAIEDLKLDHLLVVYPGTVTYVLNEKITVRGLSDICNNPSLP